MKKAIIIMMGIIYVFNRIKKQKKIVLHPDYKFHTTNPDNPTKNFNEWAYHIYHLNNLKKAN